MSSRPRGCLAVRHGKLDQTAIKLLMAIGFGDLVPVFLNIMMDNPDHPWGKPHYPLVD